MFLRYNQYPYTILFLAICKLLIINIKSKVLTPKISLKSPNNWDLLAAISFLVRKKKLKGCKFLKEHIRVGGNFSEKQKV